MLPRRSSTRPGRNPSIPPPFFQFQSPPPPPQEAGESEEPEALLISDQRTLYLVNIFIANTSRFLNSFSALCEDKLTHLHRSLPFWKQRSRVCVPIKTLRKQVA